MKQEIKDEIRRLWRTGEHMPMVSAIKLARFHLPIFTPLKRVLWYVRNLAAD